VKDLANTKRRTTLCSRWGKSW